MSSDKTPRLRLNIPTVNTLFSIEDLADNWGVLDAHPGVFICTSETRPEGWTSVQSGRLIFETDTGLHWVFGGTSFARVFPQGLLGQTRVTSGSFTATSNTTNVVLADVTITPHAGLRPLRVDASWGQTQVGAGRDVVVAIERNDDPEGSGSWVTLISRHVREEGGFLTAWDQFEAEPTSVAYRLVFRLLFGSTNTSMTVSATMPLTISVAEV